jgi:hypothetical protein
MVGPASVDQTTIVPGATFGTFADIGSVPPGRFHASRVLESWTFASVQPSGIRMSLHVATLENFVENAVTCAVDGFPFRLLSGVRFSLSFELLEKFGDTDHPF